MPAAETLRVLSSDAGWVPDVQVDLLARFIDENGLDEKLGVFLRKIMEEEISAVAASTAGPFVEFEFDPSYFGGDYSKVGDFTYVPQQLCSRLGYERAFQLHTSVDPRHIINYKQDELFDAEGDPWGEDDD